MEPQQSQPLNPNRNDEPTPEDRPPTAPVPDTARHPQQPDPQVVPQVFAMDTAKSRRKGWKTALVTLALALIIGVGAAGLFLTRQETSKPSENAKADTSSKNEKSSDARDVTIPSDWQLLDTTLGFSVKAPAGWTVAFSGETTVNNLQAKGVSLIGPQASVADPDISALRQSLTDVPGQAAFEAAVTQLTPDTLALLEQLGIKRDEIKLESSHITLAGKQWLQVDVTYPGQIARTLYLWNNDHAVGLTLLTDSTALLEKGQRYLLPMAASIMIK